MDLDTLKVVAGELLPVVVTIITPIVTVLAIWLARKAARWLGVQHDAALDREIERLVDGGIAYAEHQGEVWAKSHGELSDSEQKFKDAVTWIRGEADRRGLPQLAAEHLKRLVESRLGHPDAPGGTMTQPGGGQ